MTSSSIAFLAGRDGRPKTDYVEFFDDFQLYLATSWTKTETGSGTQAISQANGGLLVLTNAAADNDVNAFQRNSVASGAVAEQWLFTAGKKLYFGIRFKISDATQADFIVGLHATNTTPIASGITDGIFFRKDDGDTDIDIGAVKSGVTTGVTTARATAADNTFMVLEFMYDGATDADGAAYGQIQFYKDGVPIGGVLATYAPDDEELAVSFAHQNGEAVAKVMTLDWVRVVAER